MLNKICKFWCLLKLKINFQVLAQLGNQKNKELTNQLSQEMRKFNEEVDYLTAFIVKILSPFPISFFLHKIENFRMPRSSVPIKDLRQSTKKSRRWTTRLKPANRVPPTPKLTMQNWRMRIPLVACVKCAKDSSMDTITPPSKINKYFKISYFYSVYLHFYLPINHSPAHKSRFFPAYVVIFINENLYFNIFLSILMFLHFHIFNCQIGIIWILINLTILASFTSSYWNGRCAQIFIWWAPWRRK